MWRRCSRAREGGARHPQGGCDLEVQPQGKNWVTRFSHITHGDAGGSGPWGCRPRSGPGRDSPWEVSIPNNLLSSQARLAALADQWQFLVQKSAEKSQKLKEANKQQNFNTGIKDFDFWLSEVL